MEELHLKDIWTNRQTERQTDCVSVNSTYLPSNINWGIKGK